ncbi:MAG TPA: GMC family oxidoreductase [Mycobacteriales bacterium]|nr:GMC family oxidoreductase [Mycobacteriales bacterium]
MIDDLAALGTDARFAADLAVVGAGPAGIVVALEAARRGLDVVLLESGREHYDEAVQELSEAAEWDRSRHAPMSMAIRRQVGGTSVTWGGRCVPFDPVDFTTRAVAGSARWPVSYEEIREYFGRACDWMQCGRPVFNVADIPSLAGDLVPGLTDRDGVKSTDLERWSLPTNFGQVYRKQLHDLPNLRLLAGVTCITVECPPERRQVDAIECRTTAGGRVRVEARAFVIAAGGLESTRLLMSSPGPQGGELGNHSGHLGRWYMAHVEGVAAKVQFTTAPRATKYDYERDIDGSYVRRRFTLTEELQLREGVPNFAAWITNPDLADASHDRGELSFAYLALVSPVGKRFAPDAQRLSLTGVVVPGAPYGHTEISPVGEHLRNLARHPVTTGRFAFGFGTRRFLQRGRRAPGFFSYSPNNRYPLQYHAEHLPQADSQVSLTRERDALGRPKLAIDLRFASADVEGVVRAHALLDRALRDCGVGRLEYVSTDLPAAIEERLGGGFHQSGTTRMAATENDGVVNRDLRVYGVDNLYVASSSTFVTSGQANSTFMIVAFAVRLAEHLGRRLS